MTKAEELIEQYLGEAKVDSIRMTDVPIKVKKELKHYSKVIKAIGTDGKDIFVQFKSSDDLKDFDPDEILDTSFKAPGNYDITIKG